MYHIYKVRLHIFILLARISIMQIHINLWSLWGSAFLRLLQSAGGLQSQNQLLRPRFVWGLGLPPHPTLGSALLNLVKSHEQALRRKTELPGQQQTQRTNWRQQKQNRGLVSGDRRKKIMGSACLGITDQAVSGMGAEDGLSSL